MRGSSPRTTNEIVAPLFRRLGSLGGFFGLARSPASFRRCCRLAVALGGLSRHRFARGAPLRSSAAAGLGIDQRHRFVESHGLRRRAGRQGGIDAAVADIGPVASVAGNDLAASFRMLAERAAGRRGAAPALLRLFGDQRDGAVEAEAEHVIAGLQVGVSLAVLDIGAIAADAGDDRLAGLGMTADFARQRQQLQGKVEIDRRWLGALGQGGALGLFAVVALAELHIGAEAASADAYLQARFRILSEHADAVVDRLFARGRDRELPRIAALGIVRAADEGAELAELEREPA